MYKINPNNNQREWSIDPTAFVKEYMDTCRKWNIKSPSSVQFYSQQDEDKYIIQYLLKDRITDGTYLEIGGCDGVRHSNTKTLQDYFGFTGVLVEGNKMEYEQMVKNRGDKNYCVWGAATDEPVDFIEFSNLGDMGGIRKHLVSHLQSNPNTTRVPTVKLSDIIKKSQLKYIDFMIVDVEGSEINVLRTIDFGVPIYCIIVEASSKEHEKCRVVRDFLQSKGFTFKERQRGNEVWINHRYFRKSLFNS